METIMNNKANPKTRCTADPLVRYMKDYDLSDDQAAEELGTVASTVTTWRNRNNMPRFVLHAISHLRSQRDETGLGTTQKLAVMVGNERKIRIITEMASEMGVRSEVWSVGDLV